MIPTAKLKASLLTLCLYSVTVLPLIGIAAIAVPGAVAQDSSGSGFGPLDPTPPKGITPEEIIRLTKAKVPASVIEAMRNPKAAPAESGNRGSTNGSASVATVRTNPPPKPVASTPPPANAPAPVPVVTTTPAPAPPPSSTPPPAPVTRTPVEVVTLPDATPLRIALAADVPTDVPEGQSIRFVTLEDFRAGDAIVIAKGSTVTGLIVEAAGKKKVFGMGGGKATFQLMQVDSVDGHKLNIRSTPGKRADGPAQRPFELPGKKPPKDIAAMQGWEYTAYIDGQQHVSVPVK